MAVAFDAVGPAGGGGTSTSMSPMTWTHICGASATAILIGVTWHTGGSNLTTGVTYGGQTCTLLTAVASGGGTLGGFALYYLANPPTGSNTVSATFTGGGLTLGGSISVTGSGAHGSTFTGNSGTLSSSQTVSVTNTTTGGLIVVGTCAGSPGVPWSGTNSVTLRWSINGDGNTASDNAAGGTVASTGGGASQTVGMSIGSSSDTFGLIAVELLPAAAGGNPPPPLPPFMFPPLSGVFGPNPPFEVQQPYPSAPVTVAAVAVPAPPQLITVPRRKLARALWRGGSGQAYVAVPAPPQEPPVPRRRPARAIWHGSAPFLGYVAVPAPHQPPYLPPHRRLARVVWRGSAPFLGYVAVPAPPQEPPVPRRRPARAIWHGSAPFLGYVAVPAPPQVPPIPRRRPARAQWRGSAPFPGYVAVPASRQVPPVPRRKLARAFIKFTPVATVNAAPVIAQFSQSGGGILPYGGGLILQTFAQTFTSSSTWTAPGNLAGPPAVSAWGPSGTAAAGSGSDGGGAGAGAFGGEPALGGVTAGTVLTVTIGAAGSGNPTTVTGGSVTVQGNAGGNAAGSTGGAAGTAGTNTLAQAGGGGGTGGSGTGGGGGGSAGSTGAGGTGSFGVAGGAGGAAGTGAAGPPSLAGAVGGNGATVATPAQNGTVPGSGPGGGSSAGNTTPGTAVAGQAVITWQVYVPVLMAMQRRRPARARIQFTPVATTNATTPPPSGAVQPWPAVPVPRHRPGRVQWRGSAPFLGYVAVPAPLRVPPVPRRKLARAVIEFTPVATTNSTTAPPSGSVQPRPTIPVPRRRPGRAQFRGGTGQAYVFVPAPRLQPVPAPRRHPARAYVRFTPVKTTNGAKVVVITARPAGDYDGKSWWKKRWILRL